VAAAGQQHQPHHHDRQHDRLDHSL
jgi:hypothetical protein